MKSTSLSSKLSNYITVKIDKVLLNALRRHNVNLIDLNKAMSEMSSAANTIEDLANRTENLEYDYHENVSYINNYDLDEFESDIRGNYNKCNDNECAIQDHDNRIDNFEEQLQLLRNDLETTTNSYKLMVESVHALHQLMTTDNEELINFKRQILNQSTYMMNRIAAEVDDALKKYSVVTATQFTKKRADVSS